MSKEEFSKLAEKAIRELFAKAREIDGDIYGLEVSMCECDDYESVRTNGFAYCNDDGIDYRIKTHHFICKFSDGTRKDWEEVA